MSDSPVVNAWTQWGKLETVVVGRADPKSCHLPHEWSCHAEINDPELAEKIDWPGGGLKSAKSVEMASKQLANFCAVLEAESVGIKTKKEVDTELKREVDKKKTMIGYDSKENDIRVVQKGKINTLRPTETDWSESIKGPGWSSVSQYCATCPRDTMVTLGNTILEATMSKRSRYFENLACRDISLRLWRSDPERVKFIACPKPSFADSMYHKDFFAISDEQKYEHMRSYKFCVNETEPVFDAADITRCGKDIFVQKAMTTNDMGIKWLTSHFPDLRVHPVHFPYDLYPSHIDCTFVPLRPPSGADAAGDGLVLINPERPPLKSEALLWEKNGWKLLNAPMPAQTDRPPFSQSSYWLSMNLLSISPDKMVIEENEIPLYNLLREHGFDPITVPMRHMYDYGGAIHCCTWDIKRQDSCVDYFPNQEYSRSHLYQDNFNDIEVVDVSSTSGGFLLNPLDAKDGICGVGTLESKKNREEANKKQKLTNGDAKHTNGQAR
jgi:glycine amidinotransferase